MIVLLTSLNLVLTLLHSTDISCSKGSMLKELEEFYILQKLEGCYIIATEHFEGGLCCL